MSLQPRADSSSPAPVPVVYIVDDDDAVRTSLRFLLESVGCELRVSAGGGEFLDAYDPRRPGCVVLDVRMPLMGGFDLQKELLRRNAPLPIVFITGHGDVPMSVRALKGGAFDFIQKPFNYQVMIDTIQAALAEGVRLFTEAQRNSRRAARLLSLSPRERSVLDLMIEGHQTKQIAHELGISPKTVEVHRANIRQKLGTDSLAKIMQIVFGVKPSAGELPDRP
ncbi:response regulator transcription factor [Xanthobacter agilis]|jgi:FixJ family two-component response regulator|uniref:FixJ family two-component response regulator n=1 Tax=Xanthobacter agilis TaxID=47492 RepID=A0ABU0LD27_XANAG|nr:response regulator [Xanthobacter agilis]MDQ0505019.1 FixJ family two-component response regulator [Xanthobacter agilis]